jgi:hypothetical protein
MRVATSWHKQESNTLVGQARKRYPRENWWYELIGWYLLVSFWVEGSSNAEPIHLIITFDLCRAMRKSLWSCPPSSFHLGVLVSPIENVWDIAVISLQKKREVVYELILHHDYILVEFVIRKLDVVISKKLLCWCSSFTCALFKLLIGSLNFKCQHVIYKTWIQLGEK